MESYDWAYLQNQQKNIGLQKFAKDYFNERKLSVGITRFWAAIWRNTRKCKDTCFWSTVPSSRFHFCRCWSPEKGKSKSCVDRRYWMLNRIESRWRFFGAKVSVCLGLLTPSIVYMNTKSTNYIANVYQSKAANYSKYKFTGDIRYLFPDQVEN